MKIGLLIVGAELLNGTRTDTNSSWIGKSVLKMGGEVILKITVSDNINEIISALKIFDSSIKLILMTGGLGPTHDDITPSALYKFFNDKPVLDEDYWEVLTKKFLDRNMKIPKVNKCQAMIPLKGKIISNPKGSARALHFSNSSFDVIAMPGVPFEMKSIMNDSVLPFIKSKSLIKIHVKTMRTTGIFESALYELIEGIIHKYSNVDIAFLPKIIGVDLRISSTNLNDFNAFIDSLRMLIFDYYYADDEIEIEEVVGKLLIDNKLLLATAESCTGGLISDRLTNVPGSSFFFKGGIIAYSNNIKKNELNVEKSTLDTYGAVSQNTVIEMARGIRSKFNSDIGISTSGISGPSGGSIDKPVGLVFIGISTDSYEKTFQYNFNFSRKMNKIASSQVALNSLRLFLINRKK